MALLLFWKCNSDASQNLGPHHFDVGANHRKVRTQLHLSRKIAKQNEMDDPSMQRLPSIRTTCSRRNGRCQIEFENKWTMNCLESERGSSERTREVD